MCNANSIHTFISILITFNRYQLVILYEPIFSSHKNKKTIDDASHDCQFSQNVSPKIISSCMKLVRGRKNMSL